MSPFWIYLELRMMECQIKSSTHQHHNNITRNVLCACNTCRASHGFKSIFLEFATNSQLTPPHPRGGNCNRSENMDGHAQHGKTPLRETFMEISGQDDDFRADCCLGLRSSAAAYGSMSGFCFFQTIPGFTAARDDGSNSSDNQNSYSASTANPLVVIHAR